MITRRHGEGIKMRAPTLDDIDYNIDVEPRNKVLVEGTVTSETENDVTMMVEDDGELLKEHRVSAELPLDSFIPSGKWESGDEDVATVDDDGRVRRVDDGEVSIRFRHPWLTRQKLLTVEIATGVVGVFESFVSGTAAAHMFDQVKSRVVGKDPEQAMALYSTMDHADNIYVRNTECWISDVDTTCIPVARGTSSGRFLPTAISPVHVIGAAHTSGFRTGSTAKFVGNDGTVYQREAIGQTTITSFTGGSNLSRDFRVLILNEPLPEEIKPAKVIPENIWDYMPVLTDYQVLHGHPRVPLFTPNQTRMAGVRGLRQIVPNDEVQFLATRTWRMTDDEELDNSDTSPEWAPFGPFFQPMVDGDSGHGFFLILNGELVLVSVWTSSTSGSSLIYSFNEINTVMANLQGDHPESEIANADPYQLDAVDLSGFTNFGD